ncbi:MAG: Nicotinamide mononucleotide adenylyltransferase [uncultured Truepera sp.]|uniref:Nicotinamide mononucleotide adenylyltransferase n=1 Tax=uncultured Truepera sp. TaxID=543023 RepID=A0A6J4USI7_9DEIN|nr:MAG: Nicotinamide mononucleotide adenylyltransferase [uncultured Truepera sp.]
MKDDKKIGTQQKALEVNLDRSKYGTFAEIGAGQEVVRWFFQAGAAAGTIAKSISAYDMTVSDAIYGQSPRYVSRQRLETMLDYEYNLLIERLGSRGADTNFFVFANTVVARGYKAGGEYHGWMGISYQPEPGAEPNRIVIHVRMLDKETLSQQEALGILGVNLIYGALFYHDGSSPDTLMRCLLDDLSAERIEVDMIAFSGPTFRGTDYRLMALKLVQLGLSDAAMFSAQSEVLQPSEVLYKKPILVERGSFRPVTHVNLDMLACARGQFEGQLEADGGATVELMEITMKNLMATGEIDYDDFLARADVLAATGATVLISNYFEYYRLAAYLRRYTKKPIAITMGIPSLEGLFDESFYENLEGGILESFGRLFKNDTRLYIYPLQEADTHKLITVQKLKVAPHLRNLYAHLVENGYIESIDFYNKDYLHIFSRDVLAKIGAHDASWKEMVPPGVAALIRERQLFGYAPEATPDAKVTAN